METKNKNIAGQWRDRGLKLRTLNPRPQNGRTQGRYYHHLNVGFMDCAFFKNLIVNSIILSFCRQQYWECAAAAPPQPVPDQVNKPREIKNSCCLTSILAIAIRISYFSTTI